MRHTLYFFLLSVYCISCDGNFVSRHKELKLTCKCVKSMNDSAKPCEANAEISRLINNEQLVFCRLNNSLYDTLFVPLYVFNCDQYSAMASKIENYEKKDGIYEKQSEAILFVPAADTIVRLKKHQSINFYLWAQCPNDFIDAGSIYFIELNYDSSGITQSLIINYPGFDTIVPVKHIAKNLIY